MIFRVFVGVEVASGSSNCKWDLLAQRCILYIVNIVELYFEKNGAMSPAAFKSSYFILGAN